MRIIAGKHRSRALMTLQGDNTRPTLDQVKESCFNKMGQYFDGGIVLDLFSGCGNIGLECISRGFEKAVMVDINPSAVKVIQANVDMLHETSACDVICGSYTSAIQKYQGVHFDLIYIDPPYEKTDYYNESIAALLAADCIGDNTLIVLEAGKDFVFDWKRFSLQLRYEKQYRKNKLIYLRKDNHE